MSIEQLAEIVPDLHDFVHAPGSLGLLREMLGEMAISGLLSEQLASDGDGHDLLERIIQRTASRKPARKLGQREAPELEISVPTKWAPTYLGRLAEDITYGTSMKASESGLLPIIRMGNIQRQKLDLSSLKYVPTLPELDNLRLRSGDLLFNRTNSAELVGKSAVFHETEISMTFASYLIRVRVDEEVNPDFVNLWLGASYGRRWARSVRTDAIGQSNINGSNLGAFVLALPPKLEQNRIVARFQELSTRIDELEEGLQQEETKRRRASTASLRWLGDKKDRWALQAIQEMVLSLDDVNDLESTIASLAVNGSLALPLTTEGDGRDLLPSGSVSVSRRISPASTKIGTDPPLVIPSNWVWSTLVCMADYMQRGKTPSYVDVSPYPVISQRCVRWHGLDWTVVKFVDEASLRKYADKRFLRSGDLLINSTGTGTIGRVCVFSPHEPFDRVVADGHVTVARFSRMDPEFVALWMRSHWVQDFVEEKAPGTTNQIEWNLATLRSELVPVPPMGEQHRIVEAAKQLFAAAAKIRSAIA